MHHETKRPDLATSPRKSRERGFSMAEVLVATALLSVILLAVFGLITAGVGRAFGGKKMTEGSALAQAVMERANIVAPQDLLAGVAAIGGTETASSRTMTWQKVSNTSVDTAVTPAAEANPSSTLPITERNAWRALLRDTNLPSTNNNRSSLIVTMTALPAGKDFTNATIVRIQIDVSWKEFGTRARKVRLQTFNVRSTSV